MYKLKMNKRHIYRVTDGINGNVNMEGREGDKTIATGRVKTYHDEIERRLER